MITNINSKLTYLTSTILRGGTTASLHFSISFGKRWNFMSDLCQWLRSFAELRGRHASRAFRIPHKALRHNTITREFRRRAGTCAARVRPGTLPPPPPPPRGARTPLTSHPSPSHLSPRSARTNKRSSSNLRSFLHLHCCDIEIQFSSEPSPTRLQQWVPGSFRSHT